VRSLSSPCAQAAANARHAGAVQCATSSTGILHAKAHALADQPPALNRRLEYASVLLTPERCAKSLAAVATASALMQRSLPYARGGPLWPPVCGRRPLMGAHKGRPLAHEPERLQTFPTRSAAGPLL